jgi:hypothetical protein
MSAKDVGEALRQAAEERCDRRGGNLRGGHAIGRAELMASRRWPPEDALSEAHARKVGHFSRDWFEACGRAFAAAMFENPDERPGPLPDTAPIAFARAQALRVTSYGADEPEAPRVPGHSKARQNCLARQYSGHDA